MAGAHDHRLRCLSFELGSMSAPDQSRAQETAIKFRYDIRLEIKVVQDLTSDRAGLVASLRNMLPSTDSAATVPADDADRRLLAI
jgi:hypothetical protein